MSNLLALGAFVTACLVVFSYRNVSVGSALSATVVFLMISANSLAPMIGTLLEGNPITETLTVPVTVFTHRLTFAVCLLFAHYLAASSSSLAIRVAISQISRRLKIKVLIPPESLWVVGAIGLFAILLKFFHPPVVVSKILDGFAYLMPAPFLLMLPPYYSKARIKKEKVRLILYYLLQVVFSLVYNTRMAMVLPIGIVASGWLLTLLTGQTIVNQKTIQTGIIRGIVGLFLIGQFADFSTAILIERAQRDNRSGMEQLSATFNRFLDKKALANYHDEQLELLKGVLAEQEWQENYVRNPFLARFIQVKFDDNCLYRIASFSQTELDILREVTIQKVMIQLPQPVLDLFAIDIDKKYISSFSIGDEIDALSSGAEGGFKTGSIPSHAFALFYWAYPVVLVVLYYLIFSVYHGFFSPFKVRSMKGRQIPTLALLLGFTIYTNISLDGVDVLVGTLLRGIIQVILIYAIALWIIKQLKFPVNTKISKTKSQPDTSSQPDVELDPLLT
ncbi:hypothetical protein [Mucilaginibacter xinganensis]|uniref:hypothetical protein n=1 Tax=Mucilaginibacter xinganensis TaxID=1234841 RepID=UPI0012FD76DB|nr:hypothetical protein [Mucilaginibacter xinganensis]